jgi:hypothetical protein
MDESKGQNTNYYIYKLTTNISFHKHSMLTKIISYNVTKFQVWSEKENVFCDPQRLPLNCVSNRIQYFGKDIE